jgi:hypothetical protein
MPVHVKREPDTLLVERDGEEPPTRCASGAQQACLFAVPLLNQLPGAAGRRPFNGVEETDD